MRGWGLETWCRDPNAHSPAVTAVAIPEGHNADAFRKVVLENFNMSLGTGLNKLAGKAFRIGHLGYTNELTILGALAGVEMGLIWPRSAPEGRRRCGNGPSGGNGTSRNGKGCLSSRAGKRFVLLGGSLFKQAVKQSALGGFGRVRRAFGDRCRLGGLRYVRGTE